MNTSVIHSAAKKSEGDHYVKVNFKEMANVW